MRSDLACLSKWLAPAAAWLLLSGCSQQTVNVELHPLQQSGDVSYVCRVALGADGALEPGTGVPLSECNVRSIQRGERDLFALVTQTSTGEVAVLNVPLNLQNPQADEGVVDVDLATPGYGFLPIGALPGDIVTSPGGFASFVGVGEAGKPGLFALPTTELSPPSDPTKPRTLTSWPACSLPATPGAIAMLVEPPAADGTVFTSCEHTTAEPMGPSGLAGEGGPLGRRKLLVSLPDLGALAVIDAQSLLEREAGSFQPCALEGGLFSLSVALPSTPEPQVLPDDLTVCPGAFTPPQPPRATSFEPTPAGFALSDDGTLFVADLTAPLIHVVDTKNPCALSEGPSLYTRSLENAARTVTTSRLAVSPLTPLAKRFVYAIDQFAWPNASVMAFDVSPGSTDRTPIVRPGAPLTPLEAPDRISFGASARDLTFFLRDRPEIDPATGNVVIGERCEPDPSKSDSTGALYRTSADYLSGARATELRGVFASVLLTDGKVAFVDVEDFDAPCRRPAFVNHAAEENFQGCKGDPADIAEYATRDGTNFAPTVSNEVSCRMVQPHRPRSAGLGITSSAVGIRAPSLRTFPQLRAPDAAPPGTRAERPKLLGVDFRGVGADAAPVPGLVYVGSTLYLSSQADVTGVTDPLVLDPITSERHSVVLPFNEPRAYAGSNELVLTFEGPITGHLSGGFLELRDDILPEEWPAGLVEGSLLLQDPTVGYCDAGVNDADLMKSIGTELGVAPSNLDAFASSHVDFVVITADFPDDGYFRDSLGMTRAQCEATFGKFDDKTLRNTREFSIVDAQQQLLSLVPRSTSDAGERDALGLAVRDCFPAGSPYVIRAADQWVLRGSATGFRHDVVAEWRQDAGRNYLECVRDCNPRKVSLDSRVFELSRPGAKAGFCELVPKADGESQAVTLSEPAAKCIHDTPTERFAVYRGGEVSVRDMTFSWQTIGGFSTQRIDLTGVASAVSPQALVGLPGFNWLSVVDASSLGLALLSLDTLSTLTPTLY